MMNKKSIIPALVFFLAVPILAMAETDCGTAPEAPGKKATSEEKQQYRKTLNEYKECQRNLEKGKKDKAEQDRCARVNQKIAQKLSTFQNKQNSDLTIYGNIYQKLTNLSVRLKNAGLDTAKLESDLATLKTKIEKVNADYASFVDGLKATASLSCNQSQGEFMGKLGSARKILLSVRQDRLEVKNFIKNTVRPDILELRKQLAEKKGTDEPIKDAGSDTDND